MYNKEILRMQEIERKRIAEKLHDDTVQDIICLSQKLELAMLYMDKDIVQAKLELALAKKQIRVIMDGVRDTIYDLRPMILDDIGYDAAFGRLRDMLTDKGYDVHFDVDNVSMTDGVTALSVYRIVNEGCRNIVKHSQAKKVFVFVKYNSDKINITIADDGVGFSGKKGGKHFGLSFMKERVELLSGEMEIISNERGTSIHIMIPVTI
ncbi:MAG: sensor histidine kinase [Lachnospiraceae bacterium]|nr:sensor histidine kinase [Lachnospiraceae bacterium]